MQIAERKKKKKKVGCMIKRDFNDGVKTILSTEKEVREGS